MRYYRITATFTLADGSNFTATTQLAAYSIYDALSKHGLFKPARMPINEWPVHGSVDVVEEKEQPDER